MNINEKIVKLLKENNMKIAFAESCTGGLLSAAITDVSGASSVFECGICSYSNDIKMSVLRVDKKTIDEYTEVSKQTAKEMAQGVLKISGADIAVSTTGIAGPGGGTDENPVGTIYVGFADKNGVFAERKNFAEDGCNDRIEIRRRCVQYCLEKAYSILSDSEKVQ